MNFEDLTVLLAAWTGPGGAGAPPAAIVSERPGPVEQDRMNPLTTSEGRSDEEPQHRSRRGGRDEVFSRLDRTDRRHRAASTPLRRLQAAAIDRAMPDLAGLTRFARRSRR